MGFRPADVKVMSMWEFMAAVDGFVKAQGGEDKMSGAEAEDLWQWLQTKE